MISEDVQYVGFDGAQTSEKLYFNLSVTEAMDLIPLLPRLGAWSDKFKAGSRDLTPEETLEFVNILRELVNAGYGERYMDGKRFRKNATVLEDFQSSPAYDSLILGMMTNPNKAVTFLNNLLPSQLIEAAVSEMTANGQSIELPNPSVLDTTKEEAPAWIREDRDPTGEELRNMSREQLQQVYARKSGQKTQDA